MNTTDFKSIEHIHNVADKYITGLQNDVFMQSQNASANNLPAQGWKFHISAQSLEDYKRVCDVLIPEFTQKQIAFKIVKPEKFNEQLQHEVQSGKAITVYMVLIQAKI